MSDVVTEEAELNQTLELEANTKYVNLGLLTNLVIRVKRPGVPTVDLPATIVSGSQTKMEATMASTQVNVKGKYRAWAEARGAGTIRFVGTHKYIKVNDPETDA